MPLSFGYCISLKHVGEVSRDTVGDWDRLTRRRQVGVRYDVQRRQPRWTTGISKLASTNLHRSRTLVTNFYL